MSGPLRILTVDVEDWFHILDNEATASLENWRNFPSRVEAQTIRLLDLFDQYSCRATFFVLGFIAREHPQLVLEISRRGHEIATHGDMHQLVYRQRPDDFEADLIRSLEAITATGAGTPTAYRAPGFSITLDELWSFDILLRNGIETDASLFPAARAHGGISSFACSEPCVVETSDGFRLRSFPMSVAQIGSTPFVFSGGGYFRLAPALILHQLFARQKYVMTYFHPRDFDPDQPMVPGLTPIRKFKSYAGLRGAFKKLESLLNAFEFMSLGQAEAITDWESAPVVDVKRLKSRQRNEREG